MKWVVIASLVVALPTSAWAYECTRSDGRPDVPIAWPTHVVPYAVATSVTVPLAEVRSAVEVWNDVGCSDLTLSIAGVAPLSGPGIEIEVPADWTAADPDAVGVTMTQYHTESGTIVSARTALNGSFTLTDATLGCAMPLDTYDARAVITHEIGHAVGLAHTQNYSGAPDDPTMAPRVGPCESAKRDLESDDREALCALYPTGRTGACHQDAVLATTTALNETGCSTSAPHRSGLSCVMVLFAVALIGRKRS